MRKGTDMNKHTRNADKGRYGYTAGICKYLGVCILIICMSVLMGCAKQEEANVPDRFADVSETEVSDENEAMSEIEAVPESETVPEAAPSETGDPSGDSDKQDAGQDTAESETAAGQEETLPDSEGDDGNTGEKQQRILFIGDSRTIDMFADSDDEMEGVDAGSNITVYAKHGYGLAYMRDVINEYGKDNFDVLVTWMGANDNGDFYGYDDCYEDVLASGAKIIVCTVGPTDDSKLNGSDRDYYYDGNIRKFNASLVKWAGKKGVRVIDLYKYISESGSVIVDPVDGIHYLPRPTKELWDHIVSEITSDPD